MLATRHLTDRQIPVVDISETGTFPWKLARRRFGVSGGRKRAELQRCQNSGFFRQLQQLEGIVRFLGKIVHSTTRGTIGGMGRLPSQ